MSERIMARRTRHGGDSTDADQQMPTHGWTYCNAHGRGAVVESTEQTPRGTTVLVLSCGHRQPA